MAGRRPPERQAGMIRFMGDVITACWHLLADASVYVLFGLIVAGLIRIFLNPAFVARHLGTGRFASVLKASILGVPIPL
jgi:uncharacterized membrane protein YraQ (UPF0718 family)